MDGKYLVKAKVNDRNFIFGNVQKGQYGYRLGMKVTPELRNMIANAQDGSWVNWNLYLQDDKDGQRQAPRQQSYSQQYEGEEF